MYLCFVIHTVILWFLFACSFSVCLEEFHFILGICLLYEKKVSITLQSCIQIAVNFTHKKNLQNSTILQKNEMISLRITLQNKILFSFCSSSFEGVTLLLTPSSKRKAWNVLNLKIFVDDTHISYVLLAFAIVLIINISFETIRMEW